MTSKRPDLVLRGTAIDATRDTTTAMTGRVFVAAALAGARGRRRARTAAAALVPHRRRAGLAERHGHRRRLALRHRPGAEGLPGLRRRRQAGRDVLQPHQPADRAVAAARHQRQHGSAAADTAQEAAIGFARTLRPQDLAEVIDFDSRVDHPAGVHERRRAARAGDPQDVGRRLDVDVQRDLHRAEGPEEGRRDERRRHPPPGRSSCCPTARTRRACCRSRKCSIWRSDPRRRSTRSACAPSEGSGATRGFQEAEFVLRQLAQETGGRAFFPNAVAELPAIYTQISDELSSQYTVGYTSRNAKRDGAWRRVVVRVDRPSVTARTKQGYFGPTNSRTP